MKNLLYVSIISADNDELPEDIKQKIISRHKEFNKDVNWGYVLQPMSEAGISQDKIDKYIQLFEA